MAKLLTVLIIFVVTICGYALLLGFPVMWLWNYVMPYLFHVREIDFWHALCLTLLCGFLFKSSSTSSTTENINQKV